MPKFWNRCMPLARLELTIQYTSPTPVVSLHLIPRIQYTIQVSQLPGSQGLVETKTKKKKNFFMIIIGFFFTPPLFLTTKVAISFVYCSPKTIKCTQKPKIEKKFTGIDQSSERASAILYIISTTHSCAIHELKMLLLPDKKKTNKKQKKHTHTRIIRVVIIVPFFVPW